MKKTNKFLSILLALSMSFAFSLTACKNKQDSSGSDASSGVSSSEQSTGVITLDKTQLTVAVDDDFYLTATIVGGGFVTWTSSNKDVATVSSSGRVLAKKEGTVTITATVGDASASCVVTVVKATEMTGSEIQTDSTAYFFSLTDKNTVNIGAKYVVDDGENVTVKTDKVFTYQSLNEEVATVDANGVITPVALGTTEIVISCESLTAFVTADVYTDGISTPNEWMEAIKNSCMMPDVPQTDKRYYLENDIDFEGIEYDIGGVARASSSNTPEQGGNVYHFGSEINGNFYTVKNITAWKKDAALNPEEHQSIFGRTVGATVKNIGFENVVFTSSHSYGLCAIMMHHTSNAEISYCNTFTNIYAEFIYAYEATDGVKGHMATGITSSAYGVVMKDVFVWMRSANGVNLKDSYNHVYGFSYAEWVWYGGSLTNVLTFVEDVPEGEAEFLNETAGDQIWKHAKSNCYAVSTIMQAAYYAQLILDSDVWDFYPTAVPTFKAKK